MFILRGPACPVALSTAFSVCVRYNPQHLPVSILTLQSPSAVPPPASPVATATPWSSPQHLILLQSWQVPRGHGRWFCPRKAAGASAALEDGTWAGVCCLSCLGHFQKVFPLWSQSLFVKKNHQIQNKTNQTKPHNKKREYDLY